MTSYNPLFARFGYYDLLPYDPRFTDRVAPFDIPVPQAPPPAPTPQQVPTVPVQTGGSVVSSAPSKAYPREPQHRDRVERGMDALNIGFAADTPGNFITAGKNLLATPMTPSGVAIATAKTIANIISGGDIPGVYEDFEGFSKPGTLTPEEEKKASAMLAAGRSPKAVADEIQAGRANKALVDRWTALGNSAYGQGTSPSPSGTSSGTTGPTSGRASGQSGPRGGTSGGAGSPASDFRSEPNRGGRGGSSSGPVGPTEGRAAGQSGPRGGFGGQSLAGGRGASAVGGTQTDNARTGGGMFDRVGSGDFFDKLGDFENSSGDPTKKSSTTSATGNFQVTDGTARSLGFSPEDMTDPTKARAAAGKLAQKNASALAKAGLPVNDTTLAMAHHLGVGGAKKVLGSPVGTPMAKIIGTTAAKNNGLKKTSVGGYLDAMKSAFGTANTAAASGASGFHPSDFRSSVRQPSTPSTPTTKSEPNRGGSTRGFSAADVRRAADRANEQRGRDSGSGGRRGGGTGPK